MFNKRTRPTHPQESLSGSELEMLKQKGRINILPPGKRCGEAGFIGISVHSWFILHMHRSAEIALFMLRYLSAFSSG